MKKSWKKAAAVFTGVAVVISTVPVSFAQEQDTAYKQTEETVNVPEAEVPETEVPEEEIPETETPEVEVPETEAPETEMPETEATETEVPGTEMPETEASETEMPETEVPQVESTKTEVPEQNAVKSDINYRVHVQNVGWQGWKSNGETAGTTGKSLRLEGLELKLQNQEYSGGIEYRTHVQDIGWQGWKSDGQMAGTTGKAYRLEALQIRLTGEMAEHYDLYYRVHIQNYGWMPYVKNGAFAGSEGFGLRLEGLEIHLVSKESGSTIQTGQGFLKNVLYGSAHVQDIGNTKEVQSGKIIGTVGQKKRLEAVSFRLKGTENFMSGGVKYRAHVQDIGWQGWKSNGQMAGTTGQKKQVEAVQIQLEGQIAQFYDIYYRAHVQNYGWLDWAKNGQVAGTSGYAYRMEAIEVILKPKGSSLPGSCARPYLKKYTANELTYSGHVQDIGNTSAVKGGQILGTVGKAKRLEAFQIQLNDAAEGLPKGSLQYRAHVQDIGWQGWKSEGQMAGTSGQKKRLEAVQMKLTGEIAKYYNLYYRVHSQYFGWLGWAKNGEMAGTSSLSVRIEAIQVVLVPKLDNQSPYQTGKAYYNTYKYQNPKQYLQIRHVQKTLSGGGYNLSSGYMGLKVWYVQKKLGLSGRRAIMDGTTINAVKNYQRSHGLPATGVVDLTTWKKMGYSESAWYNLGAYASPLKTNPTSTRKDCIEAMISTAYQYLGWPYIIGASGDPSHGLDCSGLVIQALYSAGIDPAPVSPIRHSQPGYEYECRNLWNLPMKHVSYSQRQRGDLIFYKNAGGTIIHVAIYLGNDQVIESWPNKVVVWPIKNSHRSLIAGVARPFA